MKDLVLLFILGIPCVGCTGWERGQKIRANFSSAYVQSHPYYNLAQLQSQKNAKSEWLWVAWHLQMPLLVNFSLITNVPSKSGYLGGLAFTNAFIDERFIH